MYCRLWNRLTYRCGMPLPSRIQRAKKVRLRAYARTGGVASVAAFASDLGYASTSSAFAITEALVSDAADSFVAR